MKNLKLLPFEHKGLKDSKNLIVFLHGWPDSLRLWDKTISRLENEGQTLAISYPNFHQSEHLKFGQGFKEIVQRIKQTVDYIDNGQNLNKIFVIHDWGCFFGYQLDAMYPGYINQIVSLDIGKEFDSSRSNMFNIVFYQFALMFGFLLSFIPCVGVMLGNIFCRLFFSIVFRYTLPGNFNCTMNYLYVYYWMGKIKNRNQIVNTDIQTPICFIYGNNQKLKFYTERWIAKIQENKNNEAIPGDCGHWIMKERNDLLVQKIKERVALCK